MDDLSPEKTDTPPAPAKPSKTSKLVPALLLLNLGGTGAAVFFSMRPQPVTVMAAPAAPAGDHKESGPVVALDPFIVNLNEPDTASRYLKTTFEVELASKDALDELNRQKRDVRDGVLRYLSSLAVADTLGEANKDKIQGEIVARMDKELGGGGRVKRVFFSDFVVQ